MRLLKRNEVCVALVVFFAVMVFGSPTQVLAATQPVRSIDFERDIRPVLSDACFRCHGPDAAKRKAGLRLDTEGGARSALGGNWVVKPFDEAASELIRRVTHVDPSERMPPEDAARQLSKDEVAALGAWIRQGARWSQPWAFTTPHRPIVLKTRDRSWPVDDIDSFVLAKLEREHMQPAPDASATTLLRRVSLDLTGLPPTELERERFAKRMKTAPIRALPEAVDRLLASDEYAEHMSAQWMAAARYADTNGYQKDDERQMWRWRDWVIGAFKSNMSFDRFTIAQTAGDLLPNHTLEDQIATGFHRNHRSNTEGGIVEAEFRAEYLADQVDTLGTVWLGLTLGCARCHDHKYDPISQRDYYRLSAFFASVPQRGRAVGYPNAPPFVVSPTREQRIQQRQLEQNVATTRLALSKLERAGASLARQWKAEPASDLQFVNRGLLFSHDRNGDLLGSFKSVLERDPQRFSGQSPFTVLLGYSNASETQPLLAQQELDTDRKGWRISSDDRYLTVELVNRWLDDGLRLKSVDKIPASTRGHIAVTYDGGRFAAGIEVRVDGKPFAMTPLLDSFVNSANTTVPLLWSGDDVRVYDRVLSAQEIENLADPSTVAKLLGRNDLSAGQKQKREAAWWEMASKGAYRTTWEAAIAAQMKLATFITALPTTMVLQDGPAVTTHVLLRGEYDKPSEAVSAGIPALWENKHIPMKSRLDLARWLASPSNPLTARVFTNRLWQMIFGRGIVKSSENFGIQGDAPSHPELLDHLATSFVSSGWNVKAMLRRMVLSRTYRQTSEVNVAAKERDPENRLLARASRLRLPAEVIRDQALAIAGLLIRKSGGPSVKIPQPFGVWEDNGGPRFEAADKANRNRRSLYAYWKRTAAPPTLTTMDASSRDTCSVRQGRTNTPLQALAVMNDVTYVDAGRALAKVARANSDDRRFVETLYLRGLSRLPRPDELETMINYLRGEQQRFLADPSKARQLLEDDANAVSAVSSEMAAADIMASMVFLNLDEVMTRE